MTSDPCCHPDHPSDAAGDALFPGVTSFAIEPPASSGFDATDLMASLERRFTDSTSNLMAATKGHNLSHDDVTEMYLQEFGRDAACWLTISLTLF